MNNLKELVGILQDNKIKNISVYNLSDAEGEKYVILSTATKTLDSKKAADAIVQKYSYGDKIEGYFKGEWIVFDFDNLTLHIFLPKVREKYNLDKLYKPKKISL